MIVEKGAYMVEGNGKNGITVDRVLLGLLVLHAIFGSQLKELRPQSWPSVVTPPQPCYPSLPQSGQ